MRALHLLKRYKLHLLGVLAFILLIFTVSPIFVDLTHGSVAINHASAEAQSISTLSTQCSFENFFSNIATCLTRSLVSFGQMVTGLILTVAAKFLDFFMEISLSSASYQSDFIQNGWRIVRDLTNLVFIAALIMIAVKFVIGRAGAAEKKQIANVIVIALLVNFSLFAGQVIVDASNILARTFYNPITVDQEKNGGAQTKSIAGGLADHINPTAIVDEQIVFHPHIRNLGFLSRSAYIFLIGAAGIVLNLATAYIFFTVSFLFLGRVIGIWLSFIMSPIAFASIAFPPLRGFMSFAKWQTDLVKNAFMAPVFLFFLYLIVRFITEGLFASSVSEVGSSFFLSLVTTLAPFLFIYFFLSKAKETAESMADSVATKVAGATKSLTTAVAGGVYGKASSIVGARIPGTLNKIGKAFNSRGNKIGTASKGRLGKMLGNTLQGIGKKAAVYSEKAKDTKFDVRAIKLSQGVQSALGSVGINAGPTLGASGLNNVLGGSEAKSYNEQATEAQEKRKKKQEEKVAAEAAIEKLKLEDLKKQKSQILSSPELDGARRKVARAKNEVESKEADLKDLEEANKKKSEKYKELKTAEKAAKKTYDKTQARVAKEEANLAAAESGLIGLSGALLTKQQALVDKIKEDLKKQESKNRDAKSEYEDADKAQKTFEADASNKPFADAHIALEKEIKTSKAHHKKKLEELDGTEITGFDKDGNPAKNQKYSEAKRIHKKRVRETEKTIKNIEFDVQQEMVAELRDQATFTKDMITRILTASLIGLATGGAGAILSGAFSAGGAVAVGAAAGIGATGVSAAEAVGNIVNRPVNREAASRSINEFYDDF